MKKRILICLMFMFLIGGCSTASNDTSVENVNTEINVTQKKKTQAERISEKTIKYIDELGNPKILYLATVQNTDTQPLEFGNVTIDIKNRDDEMLKHVDMGSVYPPYIMPGEYGYICEECTQLDTSVNLDEVGSAEMHFGTRAVNYDKPDVEITELKMVKGSYSWNVLGKVEANEDIEDLFIAFPIFDENKELQSVALTSLEGLYTGDIRGFECSPIEHDPSEDFSNSTIEAIPYIY